MNAKEADQRACNINAVGCAMLRKNFTSWCHGRAPQQATRRQSPEPRTHGRPAGAGKERHMSSKISTVHFYFGGHMAHTRQTQERTRFGGAAKVGTWRHKAVTWRTYSAQGLEADTRRSRQAHGGHTGGRHNKADTRRTKFGGAATADTRQTHGEHTAGTWRTSFGHAAKAYCGQPFLENPTVNC